MIGSDVVGPTDVTAAPVKIGGADLVLPAWARSILAIRPTMVDPDPTADAEVMNTINLQSDDFAIQPYTVLTNPIQSIASNAVITGPSPWYEVNCPVNGGDRLSIYGTAHGTCVTAEAIVQVIMSDKKPGGQRHAKVGTLTTAGATGVETLEPSYTITAGSMLREIYGSVVSTTLAIDEGITGSFKFNSNDFKDPTPLKLPVEPICGAETAAGIALTGIARTKVEVGILSPCQFTNSLTLVSVPTPGKFITGVLYT